MKKNLFAMLTAATAMMAFTACSSEEPVLDNSGDGTVLLTVALPENGLSSRAFSDGLSAPDLTYAVYLSGTNTVVKTEKLSKAFSSRQAALTLNLVKGKSYDVVFWADNSAAGYTFDAAEQSVTVNYSGETTNADTRDAFFNHITFTVNGASQQNVVLYRPFAQINLGTADLDQATGDFGFPDLESALSVTTQVPDKLNLLTGKTSGATTVSYSSAVPPTGETFPVEGYKYVAMNYILVGDDEQPALIDCKYSFGETGINDLEVNNVPVRRNFRTNIFGNLFTDATSIHILISPDFNKPDYNVPDWDGNASELPAEKDGTYEITSAEQLAAVSAAVSDGNDFDGKVIKIMADIDLLGRNFTPIGMSKYTGDEIKEGLLFKDKLFKGSIDGQGHTIRNLKVVQSVGGGLGLVGQMRGNGTYIKDLTVESAEIHTNKFTNTRWSGAIVGYINAEGDQGVTIENCHARNIHIGYDFLSANFANGALVGYISSCNATISGCSVESAVLCNINSYNCGALLGKIYQGRKIVISGCSTKDVVTYNWLGGTAPVAAMSYDEGYGNGWLIGNLTNMPNNKWLDLTITGCAYNGASDWENLNGANGQSLLEAARTAQKAFPYIGSFDYYKNNGGKITVDGNVIFENKAFK